MVRGTQHVSYTHEGTQLGPQRTRGYTLKSSSVVDGSQEHSRLRNRILQLYQAGHGAIHRTSLSLPRGKFQVIVFGLVLILIIDGVIKARKFLYFLHLSDLYYFLVPASSAAP